MGATVRPGLGLTAGWDFGDTYGVAANANFDRLDALVMCSVISRALADPPVAPADGDSYIVAAGGTGAWSGSDNQIATWDARTSAWKLYAPKSGWVAWAQAQGRPVVWLGAAWFNLPRYVGGSGMISVAPSFADTLIGAVPNVAGAHSLSGTVDAAFGFRVPVPDDFSSWIGAQLYYANASTSGNPWVVRLGIRAWSLGSDMSAAVTFAASITLNPGTVANIVKLALPSLPAVSFLPGDVIDLVVHRPSVTDAGDTNTGSMNLLLLQLAYNRL